MHMISGQLIYLISDQEYDLGAMMATTKKDKANNTEAKKDKASYGSLVAGTRKPVCSRNSHGCNERLKMFAKINHACVDIEYDDYGHDYIDIDVTVMMTMTDFHIPVDLRNVNLVKKDFSPCRMAKTVVIRNLNVLMANTWTSIL